MMESFNHFNQISEQLHNALSLVVRKTALDIQAKAANNAPVDTGFLRNSIYTVTSQGSSYIADSKALPEVEKPENDLTAYVAVGASYGIYQELGTHSQPGHPYFYQAVEHARGPFEDALGKIVEVLK